MTKEIRQFWTIYYLAKNKKGKLVPSTPRDWEVAELALHQRWKVLVFSREEERELDLAVEFLIQAAQIGQAQIQADIRRSLGL